MALPARPPKPQPTSVGSAYMQPNGTLEMSLRTETQDGTIGEAFLVIPKGDPRYADMVKHLGDIKPGRGKGDTAIPGAGTKLRRQAMTRTLLIALALAGATDPCAPRAGPDRPCLPRRQPDVLAGLPARRRERPLGPPPADGAEEEVPGDRDGDPVQGRRRRRADVGRRTRCQRTASTSSASTCRTSCCSRWKAASPTRPRT